MDPETGEVRESGDPIGMVPLELASLSEDELARRIPTPEQCSLALMKAREALTRSPGALNTASAAVKAARRELAATIGSAVMAIGREMGGSVEERRRVVMGRPEVLEAQENLDRAELALEYARNWQQVLMKDVDILRSLNVNWRREHR